MPSTTPAQRRVRATQLPPLHDADAVAIHFDGWRGWSVARDGDGWRRVVADCAKGVANSGSGACSSWTLVVPSTAHANPALPR